MPSIVHWRDWTRRAFKGKIIENMNRSFRGRKSQDKAVWASRSLVQRDETGHHHRLLESRHESSSRGEKEDPGGIRGPNRKALNAIFKI